MDRLRVFRDLLAAAIGSILLMLLAPAAPSFAGVETFAEGLGVTSGVAVDPADNVYVAEYQGNVVRKFNGTGSWSERSAVRGLPTGSCATRGPRRIRPAPLVTDAGNSRVESLTGNFLLSFPQAEQTAQPPAEWSGGTIAVDTSDDVFVMRAASTVERGNSRPVGARTSQLYGIAVDSDGRVFVADLYHRVHRFSRDGGSS